MIREMGPAEKNQDQSPKKGKYMGVKCVVSDIQAVNINFEAKVCAPKNETLAGL
jgi:hypothetical protein